MQPSLPRRGIGRFSGVVLQQDEQVGRIILQGASSVMHPGSVRIFYLARTLRRVFVVIVLTGALVAAWRTCGAL